MPQTIELKNSEYDDLKASQAKLSKLADNGQSLLDDIRFAIMDLRSKNMHSTADVLASIAERLENIVQDAR